MKKKKRYVALCGSLVLSVMLAGMPVHGTEVEDIQNKTVDLQNQLQGINQDLLKISNQIADTEAEIEDSNNEILRIQDSLAISRVNEERQYEAMKLRIKYMYENNQTSWLEYLCSAKSMGDFLNKLDFIRGISTYDRNKLEALEEVREGIEQQETLKEFYNRVIPRFGKERFAHLLEEMNELEEIMKDEMENSSNR